MTYMFFTAITGLGMFLLGMFYVEEALKFAAGARFKSWIKTSTSTTPKALLSGATATAILQSSSVVTLITLSFVSVSLMSLQSGIAMIFGSNLGTTATAWIIATLGFKVKIELIALPFIGIGGLLHILAKNHKKILLTAKLLIGFGVLFLGLDVMKGALEDVSQQVDLAYFKAYPIIAFALIGFILTAIIQSSSAATAIVLSALFVELITFEQAAVTIIGTNVGTTVTAILGAIGGIPDKKRAALAHFLFNVITACIAFMLLPLLQHFILESLNLKNDLVTALALFHSIFNLLGVMVLSPFIPYFSMLLKKLFNAPPSIPTRYIHLADTNVADTAIIALRDEVSFLFVKTVKYLLLLSNIKPNNLITKRLKVKELIKNNNTPIEFDHLSAYTVLKEIEFNIVAFSLRLTQKTDITEEHAKNIEALQSAARKILYSAKLIKDIKEDFDQFSQNDHPQIHEVYNAIRINLAYMIRLYLNYIDAIWDDERCEEKHQHALQENQNIIKQTTSNTHEKGINEINVVSLLNANQSVYVATESLYEASKAVNLQFPLEDA